MRLVKEWTQTQLRNILYRENIHCEVARKVQKEGDSPRADTCVCTFRK